MAGLSAVVIGGGPAGLSAALGLMRAGIPVQILDQRKEWAGRVCGSFLSAEAGSSLEWLGLLDKIKKVSMPTKNVTLSQSGRKYSPVRIEAGFAVSRKNLEETLRAEVVGLGAAIKQGARVTEVEPNGNGRWKVTVMDSARMSEEFLETHLIVAADGRLSRFRNSAPRKNRRQWIGWNAEFTNVNQAGGELHLCFFNGGYVGTLTFKERLTNVSGLVHSDFIKKHGNNWDEFIQDIIRSDAILEELLKNAVRTSPFQTVAALPFGQYLNKKSNIFLAGDAAAVGDPFMGEGIARALSAGPMLFKALEKNSGSASELQNARDRYANLWNKKYSFRMNLGFFLRPMLQNQKAVSASLSVISEWRWPQKFFLSIIH